MSPKLHSIENVLATGRAIEACKSNALGGEGYEFITIKSGLRLCVSIIDTIFSAMILNLGLIIKCKIIIG